MSTQRVIIVALVVVAVTCLLTEGIPLQPLQPMETYLRVKRQIPGIPKQFQNIDVLGYLRVRL
jgi:hypothetical protein